MKSLIFVVLLAGLSCESEPPPAPKVEKKEKPKPVRHPIAEKDLPTGTEARFLIETGRCFQIVDSDFQFCASADPPPRKKVKKKKRVRHTLGDRERDADKIIGLVSKDGVHVWRAFARSLPSSSGIQAKFLVRDPEHETSFMVGQRRGTLKCVKSVYKMTPIDKPAVDFLSGRNFFVQKPANEPRIWKGDNGGEYALIEVMSALGPMKPMIRHRVDGAWSSIELRAKSQTEFSGPDGEKLELIDDGSAVFTDDKKATILGTHDDPSSFRSALYPQSDPVSLPPCAVMFGVDY